MWFSFIFMMCGRADADTNWRGPTPATITAWDWDNPLRTHVYECVSFCTPDRGEESTTPPTSINIQHPEVYATIQTERFKMSTTSVSASFSGETLTWAPADSGCEGSPHTYI